jgi:NAD(P)-dependent dehydrogenase (short-subunit alcohol dehydrogenase family)
MTESSTQKFVVTGAGGGLGKAVVDVLAKRQAEVLAVDINTDTLRAVGASHSDRVHTQVLDLADAKEMPRFIEAIQSTIGEVDGLFNTVAIQGHVGPFIDYPDTEFERIMRVNLGSIWNTNKAIIPLLLRRGGGTIVNTSSSLGYRGCPDLSAYTASKHAVTGLTKVVAIEHAKDGIRAYALCPSGMDAPLLYEVMDAYGDRETGMQELAKTSPDGALARPEDVAEIGVWLLADAPRHLNGIVVPVDGGESARG